MPCSAIGGYRFTRSPCSVRRTAAARPGTRRRPAHTKRSPRATTDASPTTGETRLPAEVPRIGVADATVLVSGSPPATTLATLRAAGYAPVAETAGGTVRVERHPPQRAAAAVPPPRRNVGRRSPRITTTRASDMPDLSDTPTGTGMDVPADRLLKAPATPPEPDPFGSGVPFGTDTEEIVAGYAKHLSYSDVRQVAHAIDTGAAITVEYVATSGSRTVRTLSDLELDPPYLGAGCTCVNRRTGLHSLPHPWRDACVGLHAAPSRGLSLRKPP